MALPKIKPYTYVDREHSNRVSWPVDPSRAVLLVHDMQVHFVQAFEGANLGESNDNPNNDGAGHPCEDGLRDDLRVSTA